MSENVRLQFRLVAALLLAIAGFMLLTQFPPIDTEHMAIAHASGLVLIALGALVVAGTKEEHPTR